MPEASQQLLPSTQKRPAAAALVDTTARWFGIDEDVALGCESADPSLQIERWGQEVLPSKAASS
jgi:hypothetical protein